MWCKGCAARGAKGARGACTFRTFATILHFDGAFRVTCRGRNYFAVTRQFRCRYFIFLLPPTPMLHFSEMFYCRVNLCSYLRPVPDWRTCNGSPFAKCGTLTQTHTQTHTCSYNALPHQYRDGCGGWGVGTPTHSPLSYTQCTKLKMTKQNCENCENLLHRISALCCRADVARQQLQLHHAPIPHSTLHVACIMPPGVGSRRHQAGRTWNHFLACWHCKILISILMSNCRLV